MKSCSKCKTLKDPSEFHRRSELRSGLAPWCKVCVKEYKLKYYQENSNKVLEKCREYSSRNPKETIARKAKWYRENVERLTVKRKVYNREHRAQIKLALAKYYKANAEVLKVAALEWSRANPNARRVIYHNSEAKVLGRPQRLTTGVIERLWEEQTGHCKACQISLADAFHIDHIVPSARGGLNIDTNIQLLCPTCNQKKWALPNDAFLKRLNTETS